MDMTTAWILFLGIVAGISVALPYGPVGFVVIRRFYLFGMKSGMYSALGTALSDMFYAIVVGFGLKKISAFLLSIAVYTQVGAGIILIYLGVRAMRYRLTLHEEEEENHPVQDVTSTFFLNGLNPTLVFAFALVFTLLGRILDGVPMTMSQTIMFISAIVVGTCGSWFLVGKAIHYLRTKNKDEVVQKINYITGVILLILGIVILGMSGVKFIVALLS